MIQLCTTELEHVHKMLLQNRQRVVQGNTACPVHGSMEMDFLLVHLSVVSVSYLNSEVCNMKLAPNETCAS